MPVLASCPVFVLFDDYRRRRPKSELNFVNFPVDNQDLKIIARCNGKVLKTLELPGCTGITPLGISALCNGATALTKLDLARIPSVTDKALRSIARHLKKLESLRLSHTTKVSDRGTIMIIERCLLLRELYMGDMPFVTDKTLVAITEKSGEGKYCNYLEVLNLKNLPKLTDKGMATLLGSPAVRRLRDFRLAGTRAVSNMGLIGLANISASVTHLEAKRRLAGTATAPSKKGFQFLVEMHLPGLQRLTDRGVSFVAENCPKLQVLNLKECTFVTDDGLAFVGERCPDLRVLNLEGCDCVTDKGVLALVHRKPAALRELNLCGAFHVGDVAVATVARRCPELRKIGLDGLVDVTDVAVEELLRCCVYMQHMSLAERYIMPSDAHARRFDAVRRDRETRKAKKKARTKDLQFSKKERAVLAAVDKMMAEEAQAQEGSKVRDAHYHSTQAVIRAFNGSPRVTDASLLKVVHQLALCHERNLSAALLKAQQSKLPPWFQPQSKASEERLRLALPAPALGNTTLDRSASESLAWPDGGDAGGDHGGGLSVGGSTLQVAQDFGFDMDGDLDEDVTVLVQRVARAPGVDGPPPGQRPGATAALVVAGGVPRPATPQRADAGAASGAGAGAGAAPGAGAGAGVPEDLEMQLQSSVPSPFGGPDFEAAPAPSSVGFNNETLEGAVAALRRREEAEAEAQAAAKETLRQRVREEMGLGVTGRRRRRRHRMTSTSVISNLLAAAKADPEAERHARMSTPMATQGGGAAGSGSGSGSFFGSRPSSSGGLSGFSGTGSMTQSLHQASVAALPLGTRAGGMSFVGTGMHLGMATTFGSRAPLGSSAGMGGSGSLTSLGSEAGVAAPETGCIWTPEFPLSKAPDDDAIPYRGFRYLNLSGNPRLKKLWSELASHPGQYDSVSVPPLVAVVPPADSEERGTDEWDSERGSVASGRLSPLFMGPTPLGTAATDARSVRGAPPSALRSRRAPSPSPLRKSVRFSDDVAATQAVGSGGEDNTDAAPAAEVQASVATPGGEGSTRAGVPGDGTLALHTGASLALQPWERPSGDGEGAPAPTVMGQPPLRVDGVVVPPLRVDGVVVPPLVAYDFLGDMRFINLRVLRLRGCVRLQDEAMDSMALCPRLTSLDLSGCYKISNQGLVRLSVALDRAAKGMWAMQGVIEAQKAEKRRIRREQDEAADPRLYRRRLRIMKTQGITDEELNAPKEPPPPEHPLGHLDISKLPLITDSGVTVLLAVTPNLHNLSIAKTRCSNVTVQVLANMCTKLRTLDASQCKGDDTFGFIAGAVGQKSFGLEATRTGTFHFGTTALKAIHEDGAELWRPQDAEEEKGKEGGDEASARPSTAGQGEGAGEGDDDVGAGADDGPPEYDDGGQEERAQFLRTVPSFRDVGMESLYSSSSSSEAEDDAPGSDEEGDGGGVLEMTREERRELRRRRRKRRWSLEGGFISALMATGKAVTGLGHVAALGAQGRKAGRRGAVLGVATIPTPTAAAAAAAAAATAATTGAEAEAGPPRRRTRRHSMAGFVPVGGKAAQGRRWAEGIGPAAFKGGKRRMSALVLPTQPSSPVRGMLGGAGGRPLSHLMMSGEAPQPGRRGRRASLSGPAAFAFQVGAPGRRGSVSGGVGGIASRRGSHQPLLNWSVPHSATPTAASALKSRRVSISGPPTALPTAASAAMSRRRRVSISGPLTGVEAHQLAYTAVTPMAGDNARRFSLTAPAGPGDGNGAPDGNDIAARVRARRASLPVVPGPVSVTGPAAITPKPRTTRRRRASIAGPVLGIGAHLADRQPAVATATPTFDVPAARPRIRARRASIAGPVTGLGAKLADTRAATPVPASAPVALASRRARRASVSGPLSRPPTSSVTVATPVVRARRASFSGSPATAGPAVGGGAGGVLGRRRSLMAPATPVFSGAAAPKPGSSGVVTGRRRFSLGASPASQGRARFEVRPWTRTVPGTEAPSTADAATSDATADTTADATASEASTGAGGGEEAPLPPSSSPPPPPPSDTAGDADDGRATATATPASVASRGSTDAPSRASSRTAAASQPRGSPLSAGSTGGTSVAGSASRASVSPSTQASASVRPSAMSPGTGSAAHPAPSPGTDMTAMPPPSPGSARPTSRDSASRDGTAGDGSVRPWTNATRDGESPDGGDTRPPPLAFSAGGSDAGMTTGRSSQSGFTRGMTMMHPPPPESVASWLTDVSGGYKPFDDAASEVSSVFMDRVVVARLAEQTNSLKLPFVRKRVENAGVTPDAVAALGKNLELGDVADPFKEYFGLKPVPKWRIHIARTRRHHARNARLIQAAYRAHLDRTHTLERKMGIAMGTFHYRIAAKAKIWKNWKIFKHRRAVMRMRGQAHLALMARLAEHKASKQIQRVIRGFLARQHVKNIIRANAREAAAQSMKLFQTSVLIQRIIRGKLARIHVKRMRRAFVNAVLLMQKLLRGVKARRRIARYKARAVPAARMIKHWWRQLLLSWAAKGELGERRRQAYLIQISATHVQRAVRGFVARCRVKRRRVNFNYAASRIQARARGMQQRERYVEYRSLRLAAIVRIQVRYRIRLAGRLLVRKREEAKLMQEHLNDSARVIQRNWKNRRLKLAILSIALVRRLSAAAKEIQRVWRGYKGRRRFRFYWKLRHARFIANARVALHGTQMLRTLRYGAAQRIQLRIFRHHLARRRTRDKVAARYNYMATKIQSVWRMFAMRKEFARLFKLWTASGITIQRVFRGMLGRRRFAEALYQKLLHDCSTLMCSVVRMFLAKRSVQRRRVLYNDSARVIQEAYHASISRARWFEAYVELLCGEFERLMKAGYNRKVLPLNLEKLRTAQNRAMKERMNVIYYAIEKEAVKQFESSVKMAEAKMRSVEKKVKLELAAMHRAAHEADVLFAEKLAQKRMLDSLAAACYDKNLEVQEMKRGKKKAMATTARYEEDIKFFCQALDEELAAHDNILEHEQLERVLALLETEPM